jgi:hypothetical protein
MSPSVISPQHAAQQCFEHNGPTVGRRSPSHHRKPVVSLVPYRRLCDIQCDKDMVVNPEAVSF